MLKHINLFINSVTFYLIFLEYIEYSNADEQYLLFAQHLGGVKTHKNMNYKTQQKELPIM